MLALCWHTTLACYAFGIFDACLMISLHLLYCEWFCYLNTCNALPEISKTLEVYIIYLQHFYTWYQLPCLIHIQNTIQIFYTSQNFFCTKIKWIMVTIKYSSNTNVKHMHNKHAIWSKHSNRAVMCNTKSIIILVKVLHACLASCIHIKRRWMNSKPQSCMPLGLACTINK